MGLHKIKKLLHNKRNDCQIEYAAHRMGENICQLHITKLPPKIKYSVRKWANELNRGFSKEEVQMAKIT
jgi:cellobiose-specific phosphotransferase system component IIB